MLYLTLGLPGVYSSGRSFRANMVWRSQFHVVSIFQPGFKDIRAPCGESSSGLGVVISLIHSMVENWMSWDSLRMWFSLSGRTICISRALFAMVKRE